MSNISFEAMFAAVIDTLAYGPNSTILWSHSSPLVTWRTVLSYDHSHPNRVALDYEKRDHDKMKGERWTVVKTRYIHETHLDSVALQARADEITALFGVHARVVTVTA